MATGKKASAVVVEKQVETNELEEERNSTKKSKETSLFIGILINSYEL